MILDKVQPYWTEEELQELQRIRQEQDRAFQTVKDARKEIRPLFHINEQGESVVAPVYAEWLETSRRLESEENNLRGGVELRYTEARKTKGLIADAVEVVNAIEKEDFQQHVVRMTLAYLPNPAPMLREMYEENYANCYQFIASALRVYFNAFAGDQATTVQLRSLIDKRVSRWYIKENPAYLPTVHAPVTDAFAFMSQRDVKRNKASRSGKVKRQDIEMQIAKMDELPGNLGISTDMLLNYALSIFTKNNDFTSEKEEYNSEVYFPVEEYAEYLGYDVVEHETSTPEEAVREKKRAKMALDNARKAINQDQRLLHACTFNILHDGVYRTISILDDSDIDTTDNKTADNKTTRTKNGLVKIVFGNALTKILAESGTLTQYPTKLFTLDRRNPTPYYIGRKMIWHYNIDGNQIRGTNGRIGVKTLLGVSHLATYDEVQQNDRGHWEARIKKPLEKALNTLIDHGILKSWRYTHPKGIELTDEEKNNLTNYHEYEQLMIEFLPAEEVYQEDRLAPKREERAKALEGQKKRKRTNAGKGKGGKKN